MLSDFFRFIKEHKLFTSQDKILLGVSGGIDSMVLAHLFQKSDFEYAIAHCNFGLRGKESDEDERFVREYSEISGIPFFSKKFNTKAFAEKNGISVQMAARDLRINWFKELIRSNDYRYYATAHHNDDQIETFLINLIRGTGIRGLHGILPKSGKLIHPLLFTNRKEIENYSSENNIGFREDSSNKKTDYERNRIRHELLPVLNRISPGYRQTFKNNIERFRATEKIFNLHIKETWKSVAKEDGKETRISITSLHALEEVQLYLFEFLFPFGFNESDVQQIANALTGQPGKQFYSGSHQLLIDREWIMIKAFSKDDKIQEEFFITKDQTIISNPINLEFKNFKKDKGFRINSNEFICQLDANTLVFPLKIRKWKQGDFFYPLGMKGKKLLSDYFTDRKFSLFQKEEIWLLTSSEKIVWVIGHRSDDRYKIKGSTENVLEVSYKPGN